ncbi:extensin-like isoform X1 [Daphnia pulex]|uniref:extensin-like isoform X1 n=2 Tax=Daphnia pulex TaxID=6669 RepID=UPI001EE037F4|nr:extensin-like isoform X1 [Daphnia pulex]
MSLKATVILFSMLLSVAVAQYGSSAPLPPQLHQSHRPPPPLFGGKAPKKQQNRPTFTGSVPIFRPDAGLGPLPVPPLPFGPGPLPLPSGIGPLPLPVGQGPMPAQLATPSYYYASPSMDGFPSPFQPVGQIPSFQSPARPAWQTAPSFNSYGSAQPMNFAPQGIPPPVGPPIYLQQTTSSFGSVPSKFLSPPPPSSFLTPISFGGPANGPVFPSNSPMQPSFQMAQPAQYNPAQSYGTGPSSSMMQLQQGNDPSAFGTIPQREQIQQFAGPSSYAPQSYGFAVQQFSGPDLSSQSFGGNPQQSFVGSQQPVGPPAQTYSSASQQQSFGQAQSPQSFAQVVPQQSFASVEQTQQSFLPSQSFGQQASFEQPLGPSGPSQSYSSQQQSYGTASASFTPVESQQQTFAGPSESQQFVGVTSQSFAPSPVEGFPEMQASGNPSVPIYGVPPPSQQQQQSVPDFQQSNSQDNSTPIRQQQQSSAEFQMPMSYQSAAMVSPPLPESSGPNNSGLTYDASNVMTRYVRVRN